MWQLRSQSSSSPGWVWTLTAIWFDIVPDGTNRAASLPSRAATVSSSLLTVGSSPKTSSPTGASLMAARMAGVGRVTVSLRRSIKAGAMRGSGLLLPILQEVAVADLAEEDLAGRCRLGRADGDVLLLLPLALLREQPQFLHQGRVGPEVLLRLGDQPVEC